MTVTVSTTASADVEARRARLRTDITVAARVLPTHYPLETFIAVNPLAGLEAMPFEQAARRAGDLYGTRGTLPERTFRELYHRGRITDSDLDRAVVRRYPNMRDEPALALGRRSVTPVELLRADLLHGTGTPAPSRRYRIRAEQVAPDAADIVDAQTAKWCAAFFGSGSWPMPGRGDGFYPAWRRLAPSDRTLSRDARTALRGAAGRADDALLECLAALGVGDDARVTYLQAHLTRLPGWAAHIQWCTGGLADIDLLQYLAVRLNYEAALCRHHRVGQPDPSPRPTTPTARERAAHLVAAWRLDDVSDTELTAAARVLAALPVTARESVWQHAFEGHYRDRLLAELTGHRPPLAAKPHTSLVACIDTRSEGLRRHLEARDGYQTFGFAGFFAVAIRFTGLLGGAPADLCPVLISPSHDVSEQPVPHARNLAARRLAGETRLAGAETAFHAAKDAFAAPFSLAEAGGFIAAPVAAAKTLSPSASATVRRRLRDLLAPAAPTSVDVSRMGLAERALFAQVMLTTIGLVTDFGRLVVLCGHGSSTENNPYQASLDCGACGGQSGGTNARTAAFILNQPDVREELRSAGIDIPDETLFIAALHDTATDRVTVLDRHLVPAGHEADIRRLTGDLAHAGAALAAERCPTLPGARRATPRRAARHVGARSVDWAQVYPEWGLAGNAAFVVAPREVTRGIDLQRRVFLHSYAAEVDPDGVALETILTAPLVVAQWINCQYYFSTIAPETFGAGTKTIHNVVGSAGVIAGHVGDLKLGLPRQSIAAGDGLRHEPQRLLAVIQAPLPRIDAIVERNPILGQLFGNDWVAVAAREDPTRPWQRWTTGGWCSWTESPCPRDLVEKEMVP